MSKAAKLGLFLLVLIFSFLVAAQINTTAAAAIEEISEETSMEDGQGEDLVQPPAARLSEFEDALQTQDPGAVWLSPVKHAIRNAARAGVSIETIVLLLLLPVIASIIAGARHLIGIRGFGIFLPAALSVVFLATGPVAGIGLFLVIVVVSTLFRLLLRKITIKLQYLPRMALILWAVVLGVLGILFASPLYGQFGIPEVSIFPVLILVLLSEDFTRVQLGKSARVAVGLTSETLILALVSFTILSLRPVQYFALLNPEIILLGAAVFNIFIGRYVGLRLIEYWRFRRLIRE